MPADRQEATAQREAADRTEPALAAEKAEKTDAMHPTEPIDRIEPADPIDRIEPAEPMLRIEPLEPIDRIEPSDPRPPGPQSPGPHPPGLRPAGARAARLIPMAAFSHCHQRERPRPTVGRSSYAAGMANFAVTMTHGPHWDPACGIRDQAGWDAHAAYMDTLVDEGFVIIGGPLGTDRALVAVAADDEQAVRDRMAADPWAPAGVLRVGSVEPWSLWLDCRLGRAA